MGSLPSELDVTVVTTSHPAYAKMLSRTLNGVLSQSCKPVHHCISMDSRSSGDPCWQLNRLLAGIETEWVAQVAGDDWWLSNHLAVLALLAQENPEAVYCYTAAAVNGAILPVLNHPVTRDNVDELQDHNWIPASGMAKTEVMKEFGGWQSHPETGGHEDWELYKKIAGKYGAEGFAYSDIPTWVYEHHGKNRSYLRYAENVAKQEG